MASISFGSQNPLSMMLAPLAASPRAIPRPIPLVEPVTMADFPDNMCTTKSRGDACDIAVVPAGEKEAVTNTLFHYDRDAPWLVVVLDRGVRYFLQTHDSPRPVCLALKNEMPFLG